MLSSVIEQTLNLLAFRYDIDEEIQAQKDAHAKVFQSLISSQMRKAYIEKLAPLKPILEKACKSIGVPQTAISLRKG